MTEAIVGIRLRPPETTGREKLTDEQMDGFLSAFGNHEAKALTLIAMQSGNIFTRDDLHRTVMAAQGKNPAWITNDALQFGYCKNSLAPIGLVAKETLNEDLSTYGYQITKYGKQAGIPLAGLLLAFSEKHQISLNKIFADTQSSVPLKNNEDEVAKEERKKRASAIVRKILYELATTPSFPIRLTDLADNIKELGNLVGRHLSRLNEAGLINYDSKKVNQPITHYRLADNGTASDQSPPVYYGQRTLSTAVYKILKAHSQEYVTTGEVVEYLPQEVTKTWTDKEVLKSKVSGILKNLKKSGWAQIKQFEAVTQSEIKLSEEQQAVILELVEILDRFQDQDTQILEEGRRHALEILCSPKRVSQLMQRAKEASAQADQWSSSKALEIIFSIISAHPGITNQELRQIIKNQENKQFKYRSVSHLTSELLRQGKARVEKQGSLHRFFPASLQTGSQESDSV